jgi:hypothetical protein
MDQMNYHRTVLHMFPVAIRLAVFDPGKAGWKMDGDKLALDAKGNPIWVDANGGERAMEGDAITRLNNDAKTLRQRAETAEATAAAFKDIDPAAAKKAIETVKNIDLKKLIDAGEVDKVRTEISAQFTAQLAEKDKALTTVHSELDNMRVNNVFANSEYIRENIAMPREFFEAAFRQHFKPKDGAIQAFDKSGNPIYSRKSPGAIADPEEALEILVDTHPQKTTILKAADHQGSGNNGNGGGRNQLRTLRRGEFEKLPGMQQAQFSKDVTEGKAQLID